MSYSIPPDLLAALEAINPYRALLIAFSSAVASFALLVILFRTILSKPTTDRMSEYFGQFLETEGVPSIRLASGLYIVLLASALEIQFCTKDNVQALVEMDFVFVGVLFGLGTAKILGKAFAARPPGPATQVNAKKAAVDVAGDANFQASTTSLE